jgi:LacI family transcriptional regulator
VTRPGRPTLADVASRAGVSLKTASRAVNGEYGVAKATKSKVLQAVRELGFRPNHLARSLAAGGPSAVVGLVSPAMSDPFIAAIAGAVESVLGPRDLHVLTASHADDPERQRKIVRTFVERRLDAIVFLPAPGDASYLNDEIGHGLVVVSMDRPLVGVSVDTVLVDNRAGAAGAVARLTARGHRRIAAIGNDPRLWTLQERHEGYRAGLSAAGLSYDPAIVEMSCGDAAGAERAVRTMLDLADPPTAVFAIQNMVRPGVVRAVRHSGISLDTAVFDELVDADLLVTPPSVVVASGPDRLGHLAASMVIERLDGLTVPARSVVLPPVYLEAGETYQSLLPLSSVREVG